MPEKTENGLDKGIGHDDPTTATALATTDKILAMQSAMVESMTLKLLSTFNTLSQSVMTPSVANAMCNVNRVISKNNESFLRFQMQLRADQERDRENERKTINGKTPIQ